MNKIRIALLGIGISLVKIAVAQGPGPLGPVPVPTENPITEEKRILGKILFWDEQLSTNDRVSCGTCHIPSSGGADPRLALNPGADGTFGTDDDVVGSMGVPRLDGSGNPVNDPTFGYGVQVTGRAAPSNLMAGYSHLNFWDGRAGEIFTNPEDGFTVEIASGAALENQAIQPILSSIEMARQNRDWDDVRAKLESVTPLLLASDIPTDMQDAVDANPTYPELFELAFGTPTINATRIAKALATYQRTLVPDETPWDLHIAGDTNALTADQKIGLNFLNMDMNCFHCHTPPMFTDNMFHNIGLRPSSEDLGRENITQNPNDRGAFKTPSLRNIGLRATLGHHGQLVDAEDAINFYLQIDGHVQFTQDQSLIPLGNGQFANYAILNIPVQTGNGTIIRANVIDFLMNGLTDPRVANEEFPFDRPTLISEMFMYLIVYCNSNYDGLENGTITKPYDTLREALVHIQDNATVRMTGNHTDIITIDRPVTLVAWSGVVTIGNSP